MTEKQRTRYPWDSLEVGDAFTITQDNPKGFNHVSRLVYARNKRMELVGDSRRYTWFRNGDYKNISRIA